MAEDYGADSESFGHRNYGNQLPRPNGSYKVVWAWAGFATLIAASVIGAWMLQQHEQNRAQDQAIATLAEQLARMDERLSSYAREIERLRQ